MTLAARPTKPSLYYAWVLALIAAGATRAAPADAAPPPRFFVVVRDVEEAPGVRTGLVPEMKALFRENLGRRPELTLAPPPELGAATAAELPADPEALRAALRAHKLKAIEVTLRILEITSAVDPPPAGKPFRVLKRGIRLSVFGTTLPDKVMAIGGDGDSMIAAEVRKSDDLDREGKQLLAEAAKIAIGQAVDMTVTKLMLPSGDKKKPPKKK